MKMNIDRFFLRLSIVGLIGTCVIIALMFISYSERLFDPLTLALIYVISGVLVALVSD